MKNVYEECPKFENENWLLVLKKLIPFLLQKMELPLTGTGFSKINKNVRNEYAISKSKYA